MLTISLHSLFRIIRRVCEYPWIEVVSNAIAAFDHHAMLVSVNECVIQEDVLLSMKCLTMAVGHEFFIRTFASCVDCGKILERVRQLVDSLAGNITTTSQHAV